MPSVSTPPSRPAPPRLLHERPRPAERRARLRPRRLRHRLFTRTRPDRAPTGAPRDRGAPSVLVVDDERPIRTICRVNLEAAGMAVLEAADGTEALAVARSQPPDLVLLDVMMPGLDGWEVAAALSADPELRELPVVFLSARGAPEDRQRARELGAVGYVIKPFDPTGLAGTLATVLDRLERGERERLQEEVAPEP